MNKSPIAVSARCAVYYRVSTEAQNLECQRPDVERVVGGRGLTVVRVFEEKASAVKRRPQFEHMMAAAAAGEFGVLVVWALDRFGRSMAGNINDLLALDKLGVKVVSVREPWLDTGGPVRELLVAIFSWVAQQERARLIERTKAGIAAVRASGRAWGRPSTGLVPDFMRAGLIDRWVDEGRPDGFKGLAGQLGCASPTTARKLWMARYPYSVGRVLPSGEAELPERQKTEPSAVPGYQSAVPGYQEGPCAGVPPLALDD
jgi:putative DNA-invertase from lambdoid prophage Rac